MALQHQQTFLSSASKPSAFRSPTSSSFASPASLELSIWYNSLVSMSDSKESSLPRTMKSRYKEAVGSAMTFFSEKMEDSCLGTSLKDSEMLVLEIFNLYKVLLKQYLHHETIKTPQADSLLSNRSFLHSLLAFCFELHLFVKDETSISFEEVLELLNVSTFDFWKQVNYFAAFKNFIPASLLVYFKKLNHKILTESAWKGSSDFFKAVFFAFSSSNNKARGNKQEISRHSYTQFFRKLIEVVARRIHLVCTEIGLNEEMQEAVWTLTKYFLSEYTEYLKDNNVEIVILCGINVTCKMKCEIPLATLFHKYKEVTGLDRFMVDCKQDEATAVSQFYNNVYLLLMKKFLTGNISDASHRIEALYPVTPLKDCLPDSPVNEICPVWVTPRTLQLINSHETSSPKSSRRIVFDDYLKPTKKAKLN